MAPGEPQPDPLTQGLGDLAWIQGLARRLCPDEATADDLAQDAAALALGHPRAPREDPRSLRAWLGAALPFLARSRRRSAERRALHEARAARPELAAPVDELVERAELQGRILAAVLALPEPHRTTFLMRHVEGLPPRAIAAQLGVPVVTVYSRLERGLADVRARLLRDGACPLGVLLAPLLPRSPAGAAAPSALTPAPLLGALAMKSLGLSLTAAASALVALVLWRSLDSAHIAPSAPGGGDSERALVAIEDGRPPGGPPLGSVDEASSPAQGRGAAPVAAADPVEHAPGALVRGRVTREDGRPVAGAAVSLGLGAGRDQELLEALADPGGRFAFALPARGSREGAGFLREVVVRPGSDHTGARVDLERFLAAGGAEELALVVGDGAALSGVVLDPEGRPVAGAEVHGWLTQGFSFEPPHRAADRVAACDERGRFTLPGLGGWFVAAPHAPGRIPWVGVVGVWGGRPTESDADFTLVLADACEVAGRVVDERGRPVEGAEVALAVPELPRLAATSPDGMVEPRSLYEDTRSTGADGAFTFAAAPRTRLALSVAHPTHMPWHGPVALGAAPVLVTLQRGASIRGVVRDEAGAPVAGARVAAWHTDRPTQRVVADATGGFQLDGLDLTREVLLTAYAAGHAPGSRSVAPVAGGAHEASSDVVLTLPAPAALRGTLEDPTGAPVAGATVHLAGGPPTEGATAQRRALIELTCATSATVDFTGGFVFDGLPSGRYTLTARAPRDPLRKVVAVLEVGRGATSVALALPREATEALVSGRVVEASTGRALRHFRVDVKRATGDGWTVNPFEQDAVDGRFQAPLAWTAGQTYCVEVTAPGYTAWRTAPMQLDSAEARGKLVDLEVALDPAQPLTLRIVPAEGSTLPEGGLALRFARLDGEPVLASTTGFAPGFVYVRPGEERVVQGLPRAPLQVILESGVVDGAWQRWTVDVDPALAVDGRLLVTVDFRAAQRMTR